MPGLIDPQGVLFDHSRVVLDGALRDDDIADPQPRVQTACHAGERDRAAAEPVGEQRRHHSGINLAHPGSRQHHPVAVEVTHGEPDTGDLLRRNGSHGTRKVGVFLRERAEKADRHGRADAEAPGTHARRGSFEWVVTTSQQ